MKKSIIAAAFALIAASGMAAELEYSHSVVVNLKEGNSVSYKFEDIPVATIEGDNLKIEVSATHQSVLYPFADVVNLTFDKKPASGVSEVESQGKVYFGITADALEAGGLEPGTTVNIYDTAGALRMSGTADGTGTALIATSGLDKGV